MERASIAVIGSGNVATHLATALDAVADVAEVCSRDIGHAQRLAGRLRHCRATDKVSDLSPDHDFYLIAVNDDAIAGVAEVLPHTSGVVMHTSGSVPIGVLDRFARYGVFYPLQTFSAQTPVDVSMVPFFIEASDAEVSESVASLARKLGDNVYFADSTQRGLLHVAAVFGSNFFNRLLEISDELLRQNGYALQVLRPLLEVTLAKAMDIGPHAAQTGPAVRHDKGTMDKHIALLDPDKTEIYSLLSRSIMEAHPKTKA